MITTSQDKAYKVVNDRCAIKIWGKINKYKRQCEPLREKVTLTQYRCTTGEIKTDFRYKCQGR